MIPSEPEGPSAVPLAPQAERRRRQFIEIAQKLIVDEGIDAVRIPRVAEMADCGRTLFYRYFPRREDLLLAVLTEYYAQMAALSPEVIDQGMRGFVETGDGEISEASSRLMALVWDGLDQVGHAGLVLRASPELSRELQENAQTFRREYDSRWIEPMRAIGMSDAAAEATMETSLHLLNHLYTRVRCGELVRDVGLDLWLRAMSAVVRGLRNA